MSEQYKMFLRFTESNIDVNMTTLVNFVDNLPKDISDSDKSEAVDTYIEDNMDSLFINFVYSAIKSGDWIDYHKSRLVGFCKNAVAMYELYHTHKDLQWTPTGNHVNVFGTQLASPLENGGQEFADQLIKIIFSMTFLREPEERARIDEQKALKPQSKKAKQNAKRKVDKANRKK